MPWLIAMLCAISTHSEAWNGTGRNPRAVLPINVACCGCSASRKQYVRRTVPIAGRTLTHRLSADLCRVRQSLVAACRTVRRDPVHAMMPRSMRFLRLAGVLSGLLVTFSATARADVLGRLL